MEVQKELKLNNLEIIGMNPLNRKWQIRRFVKKYDYKNINLYCSKEVASKYFVRYYPTIYIINVNGVIMYSNTGFSSNFKEEFKAAIQKKLKKNIIPQKIDTKDKRISFR